jgi:RimJ/RimL family protein N-acetyltransferase
MDSPASAADQPSLTIAGDKVALSRLRRDLLPLYERWYGDFEVGVTFFKGELVPENEEGAVERYERAVTLPGAARVVAFTVYEQATLRPIGTASLYEIDHYNRTAQYGVLLGEKECWGRGYGTEATALTLDYGFTLLGLHSIMLTVFSYNERAIRAYTRAGFRVVGRWREAKRLGDRAYDIVCMDCLATEFQGSRLRRLLPDEVSGQP